METAKATPRWRRADLLSRVGRVLRFDRTVFREIRADAKATRQAWAVVGGSALTTAVASIAQEASAGTRLFPLLLHGVNSVAATVIGFVVWSVTIHLVGTRLLHGTLSLGELVRVLGFTVAPNLFAVLGVLPGLGLFLSMLVVGWSGLLGVAALREIAGLDTPKALLVVLLSGGVLALVMLGWMVVSGVLAIALGLGATSLVGGRR